MNQEAVRVINTIRIISTVFLVVGFLAIMAGLIVSINNMQLSYEFFSETTEATRNAAQENSVISQVLGTIESNKLIANGLFASGIGSLLFGIGLALVDLLRLTSLSLRK